MEGFLVIIYIVMLVWGILNIILFFKIWGMTNDVNTIKEYLCNNSADTPVSTSNNIDTIDDSPKEEEVIDTTVLIPGTKVIHKTLNKVMIIDSINNNGNAALCKDENGEIIATYHLKNLKKI